MIDTYSEAWRLECEARLVLTMPLDKRRDYLTLRQHFGASYAREAFGL
jgi:hypothetical protein